MHVTWLNHLAMVMFHGVVMFLGLVEKSGNGISTNAKKLKLRNLFKNPQALHKPCGKCPGTFLAIDGWTDTQQVDTLTHTRTLG